MGQVLQVAMPFEKQDNGLISKILVFYLCVCRSTWMLDLLTKVPWSIVCLPKEMILICQFTYIQGGPKRTERHTSGNKDIK